MNLSKIGTWGAGVALWLSVVPCGAQDDNSKQGSRAAKVPTAKVGAAKTPSPKDWNSAKGSPSKRTDDTDTLRRGSIVHHPDFPSELIPTRPVDVWLPEGYDATPGERYPVIYMHDGQFMFDHQHSPFAGTDWLWDVDKTLTRLMDDREVRPAIVVAVWMDDRTEGSRGAEYMPQKPVSGEVMQSLIGQEPKLASETISSDDYLKFLVDELKPFIDKTYRTRPDRDHTFVIGSSMGGLISAYAVAEYPSVFGGAACMSSSWNFATDAMVDWFGDHWPDAGAHRIYFDRGTATYDAEYESGQQRIDDVMRQHGYVAGEDWVTRVFEGADHSPRAWRERLHVPLEFLLGHRSR